MSERGYLIFDDTVLGKKDSEAIDLVRWQYSGNKGKVIRGIGIVICVYYNPKLDQFWALDYRISASEEDGKSKISHIYDMLQAAMYSKHLSFKTVLMDTWYAVNFLMKEIDRLGKIFYVRSNPTV